MRNLFVVYIGKNIRNYTIHNIVYISYWQSVTLIDNDKNVSNGGASYIDSLHSDLIRSI